MFDKNAEKAIQNAAEIAKARRHEYVCLEHLLYAILENEAGGKMVRALGGKVDELKARLEDFFNSKLETVSDLTGGDAARTVGYEYDLAGNRGPESDVVELAVPASPDP